MRRFIIICFLISAFLNATFAKSPDLTDIKVIHLPADRIRIDFKFSGRINQPPVNYITQKPHQLVLDFKHAKLQLIPGLISQKIKSSSVRQYRIVSDKGVVKVFLDIEPTVSYSASTNGSIYTLLLNGKKNETATLYQPISADKRISLNFQNISIPAVLQILGDFKGINMVVGGDVTNNITLRLNDIPWEQALNIILTTQGLDMRQKGNVMFIDTKIAFDKKDQERAQKQQIKQLIEPMHSGLISLNYAKAADIAAIIKEKQSTLLSERGIVSVDGRTNSIWIHDIASKITEAKNLIKLLDVPVRQVLIEARIVEMTKDFSQDIGIRWGVSTPTHFSGSLEGGNQLLLNRDPFNAAVVPIAQRLNLDLIAAPVRGSNPATLGIALAKLGNNILLDLELSALESEGRAELISSPRLITTNQQTALIESGKEIPYQESTSSGATAVSFKKAVLSLKVTPQITPDNKILMELQINQDIPSADTFNGVPAIITKEIQTNVLVNNEQTIVLGGIYRRDKNSSIKRVPFLGDLPGIGFLFRNKQTILSNDELLIFITPKIISNSAAMPLSGEQKKEFLKSK